VSGYKVFGEVFWTSGLLDCWTDIATSVISFDLPPISVALRQPYESRNLCTETLTLFDSRPAQTIEIEASGKREGMDKWMEGCRRAGEFRDP